jgi:acyl-CoA dehydrogenase
VGEAGIVSREAWKNAGTAGLLCADVDPAYGGAGADFLFNIVVMEELARAGMTAPGFIIHSEMVAPYLVAFGSEAQKRRWLPPMVAGDMIGAVAMTEPSAGSDLKAIRTRAVRQGDEYVITGKKVYISNGQLADLAIVACKTDPEAGARGISLIVVETDRPGFRRGRNFLKIGVRGQDTSELFFDGVRVPSENILGGEGRASMHSHCGFAAITASPRSSTTTFRSRPRARNRMPDCSCQISVRMVSPG